MYSCIFIVLMYNGITSETESMSIITRMQSVVVGGSVGDVLS